MFDRIFPVDALASPADAYAKGLAALSWTSICAARALVDLIADAAPEGRERAASIAVARFAGPDVEEGVHAFRGTRLPRFGWKLRRK